mmetsp:Transcript_57224/g.177592  ORF Transcript_57224/g.177592 Transcript_57224/m.177592 type:complete len:420 (+) Transcript_57224:78-1337(+)
MLAGMVASVVALCGHTLLGVHVVAHASRVVNVPVDANGLQLGQMLGSVYDQVNMSVDAKAYGQMLGDFAAAAKRIKGAGSYHFYSYLPDRPHCDMRVPRKPSHHGVGLAAATDGVPGAAAGLAGSLASPSASSGLAGSLPAFPGGAVKKLFGFDYSKFMFDLSSDIAGPASMGLLAPLAAADQTVAIGAGLAQAAVSAVLHIVPPLIPPPAWNNKPLFCLPMLTGHNCFGAVLYPITMADFVIADVTDALLNSVVAGFPNTYANKVGKTTDIMYKLCFSAYMSMHCSSVFPRCTEPQSRDEPMHAGGRVPMCMHLCIFPLVMCPGFWVNDIIGPCSMVSVPPSCTQAVYWNMFALPPQYVSFDEANPFPRDCPKPDFSPAGMDAFDDPALYDPQVQTDASSPILSEAARVAQLPHVSAR